VFKRKNNTWLLQKKRCIILSKNVEFKYNKKELCPYFNFDNDFNNSQVTNIKSVPKSTSKPASKPKPSKQSKHWNTRYFIE